MNFIYTLSLFESLLFICCFVLCEITLPEENPPHCLRNQARDKSREFFKPCFVLREMFDISVERCLVWIHQVLGTLFSFLAFQILSLFFLCLVRLKRQYQSVIRFPTFEEQKYTCFKWGDQVFPSLSRPKPESLFLIPIWVEARAATKARREKAFSEIYVLVEINTSRKHLYTKLRTATPTVPPTEVCASTRNTKEIQLQHHFFFKAKGNFKMFFILQHLG